MWRLLIGTLIALATLSHSYAADPQSVDQLKRTKTCPDCDLSGADLQGLDLTRAYLERANLKDAILREANLDGAVLQGADLSGAHMDQVHLKASLMTGAKLVAAHLQNADLTESLLNNADFTGALLQFTQLQNAKLYGAHFDNATFEPLSLPDIWTMRDVSGLNTLNWQDTPRAINLLRGEFKKAALWDQEKALTYALREQDRGRLGAAGRWFELIFFEATCQWGASAARPLIIMLCFVPFFTLVYLLAIVNPLSGAAIWRVWNKDVIRPDASKKSPMRLSKKNCNVLLSSLYFSILSAFTIGWKDLNIGSWLVQFSPEEYSLRGTGWVRTVSGLQSIISVYLLALAVLSYFGRPFE